jgi:hypothetical protein
MSIILPFFPMTLQLSHQSNQIFERSPTGLLLPKENPYPFISAIPLPEGYTRITLEKNSFGQWLRNISLKKDKTVYLYDGSVKKDQSAQFAVLNISTGNKDLQQCADAVMRLRAEYLYAQKRFDEIIFRDNDNKSYSFGFPTDREHFNKYLENVFSHCGTLSLEKQLHVVKNLKDLQIGDVLIQGGSPGHAMLVVDMAMNNDGKKIFLLAQGYMPAQDIHIVNNPMNTELSPWYEMNDQTIFTPGWTFFQEQLKHW